MRKLLMWAGALVCLGLWLNGCAVMPRHLTAEALPTMPYAELTQHSQKYEGQTVILGGYILSVENHKDHSRLRLLQTPLGTGQRPKSKDLSQGRLTLVYDGFLDAEVFTKDRQVTAGGRILEPGKDAVPPYPHMRIAASHIHLWPVESESYKSYHYDRWYPYPWWRWNRHRFHRHRHHYRHHR